MVGQVAPCAGTQVLVRLEQTESVSQPPQGSVVQMLPMQPWPAGHSLDRVQSVSPGGTGPPSGSVGALPPPHAKSAAQERAKASGVRWREMARSSEILRGKKEAALLALLTSRSVEDAARTADVPLRTLYRWMNEPEFDSAYRKAKRAAFG